MITWSPELGFGQDFVVGDLKVTNPRLAVSMERGSRALSMSIFNNSNAPDILVSVISNKLGEAVLRIPSTRIVPRKGIQIPPHAAVFLDSRHPFISFQDIKTSGLASREEIKLFFENSGELKIEALVETGDAKHGQGHAPEIEAARETK